MKAIDFTEQEAGLYRERTMSLPSKKQDFTEQEAGVLVHQNKCFPAMMYESRNRQAKVG